jgi:hypothetical protein
VTGAGIALVSESDYAVGVARVASKPALSALRGSSKRGRLQVATVKANRGTSILTSNFKPLISSFRRSAITAGAFAEHPSAIAIFAGDVVAEATQPAAEALRKLVPCAP